MCVFLSSAQARAWFGQVQHWQEPAVFAVEYSAISFYIRIRKSTIELAYSRILTVRCLARVVSRLPIYEGDN